MKVHVASDEKFSSGSFAWLEFLHSLQVVFQFIKHSFCAWDRQVCLAASFHFSFFQSCPLPASSDEVFFKFIFVSLYLLPRQKLFIQNIN